MSSECFLWSDFIFENAILDGSPLSDIIFNVSPSMLFIDTVRSWEPKASKLSLFHSPHVMLLVCFPKTGIRLKKKKLNEHKELKTKRKLYTHLVVI